MGLEIFKDQVFNECDYGDLIGMNKDEVCKEFGEDQVYVWCWFYDVLFFGGESFKMIVEWVLFYYKVEILLWVLDGNCMIVVVYGNFLCLLIMDLENLLFEEILKCEFGIGILIIYWLDENGVVFSVEDLVS